MPEHADSWQEMDLRDMVPNPRNPRKIGRAEKRRLKRSLKRWGLVENLVWNKRTSRLVGGHQRCASLLELGIERAMVRVVDLSEDDELALMVHLNNPHAQGDWEDGSLQSILQELETFDAFEGLGLDELYDLDEDDDDAADQDSEADTSEASDLTYSVIVDLDEEAKQASLLAELEARGFKCRLLIS